MCNAECNLFLLRVNANCSWPQLPVELYPEGAFTENVATMLPILGWEPAAGCCFKLFRRGALLVAALRGPLNA